MLPKLRVLSEGEKHNAIALQAEGDTEGSGLQNLCVLLPPPCPHRFGEEFYSNASRVGLPKRIRVCAGPASFNLASGALLLGFWGSEVLKLCDLLSGIKQLRQVVNIFLLLGVLVLQKNSKYCAVCP